MSGRRAKKIRNQKRISKKAVAACSAVLLCTTPSLAKNDFLITVYPQYSYPVPMTKNNSINSAFGAGLKLEYRPLTFMDFYLKGDYLSLNLPNVSSLNLFDASVGIGYHIPIGDNFGIDLNADVGAYTTKLNKQLSGLAIGGGISFSYKINNAIAVSANAGASHFVAGSSSLMTGANVSPALSFNLTKAFDNKARVQVQTNAILPVFPVLYSWYEYNPFAQISLRNDEEAKITDVNVSFYQSQYMAQPKLCATYASLNPGESIDVDLVAFFNETMLNLTEKTDTLSSVIVEYNCMGQKKTVNYPMIISVYSRNSMSWDDDRRASVFVSSKDPAALLFAKYVTSIVSDNTRDGVPLNVQYAMGIFDILDEFGLNYVIDPSSAYSDNVGSSSVDFLQFPYQTLMYRGGDCDDLSILTCSLFEAVGIPTAFITIPGHIYMAFDSGLKVEQARSYFSDMSQLIIDDGEVWIPLEITLTDEGFNKAWRVGAREWNTAQRQGTNAMYKMSDSWEIYNPVSVPGASVRFSLPDEKTIAKVFKHGVDEYIQNLIEPKLQYYTARLAVHDDYETRNNLGVLYGKYGLYKEADEQFKNARRNGYVPAIINTANVYFTRQQYEVALKWYRRALLNEPDNVYAMLGVARCSYELGDYDICDEAYSKVIAMNEDVAKDFTYLGTFVESTGRSFSLSERLKNTAWIETEEPDFKLAEEEPEQDENLLTNEQFDDAFDLSSKLLVVQAPDQTEKKTEKEEAELEAEVPEGMEGGNDDDKEKLLALINDFDITKYSDSAATENALPETSKEVTEVAEVEDVDVIEVEDVTEEEKVISEPVLERETAAPESEVAFAPQEAKETETVVSQLPLTSQTTSDKSAAEIAPAAEEVAVVETEPAAEEVASLEPAATTTESAVLADATEVALNEEPVAEEEVAAAEVALNEEPVAEEEVAVAAEEEAAAAKPVTAGLVAEYKVPDALSFLSDLGLEVSDPKKFEIMSDYVDETAEEKQLEKAETQIAENSASSQTADREKPVFGHSELPVDAQIAKNNDSILKENPEASIQKDETELENQETGNTVPSFEELTEKNIEIAKKQNQSAAAENTVEASYKKEETESAAVAAPVEEVIPNRAIPRFTKQPSSEWASGDVYQMETIPEMKSYEEEMGAYQNEKAYLYQDEVDDVVDPEHDVDVIKKVSKVEVAAAAPSALQAALGTAASVQLSDTKTAAAAADKEEQNQAEVEPDVLEQNLVLNTESAPTEQIQTVKAETASEKQNQTTQTATASARQNQAVKTESGSRRQNQAYAATTAARAEQNQLAKTETGSRRQNQGLNTETAARAEQNQAYAATTAARAEQNQIAKTETAARAEQNQALNTESDAARPVQTAKLEKTSQKNAQTSKTQAEEPDQVMEVEEITPAEEETEERKSNPVAPVAVTLGAAAALAGAFSIRKNKLKNKKNNKNKREK